MTAPVAEQLDSLRAQLELQADPVFREGVQRYFGGLVDAYGVRMPAIRKMAAAVFRNVRDWPLAARNVRDWPLAARNKLCTELWKSGKLEEGALAVCLYERFGRYCGVCEFHLFEKWIDRFVQNWAHCDGVSTMLVAAALANEPSLIDLLPDWAKSANRWKRRAAAVSLVREARKGRHTAQIFTVAQILLADPDDMVRKGVGWLLKDAYPAHPKKVVKFLRPHRAVTPRLVLRIAAEKMTPGDRAAILGAAR